MTYIHAEQTQMLRMLRERAIYRHMAHTMQEALKAIVNGESDAKVIAQKTLDKLAKEYGNGPQQT